MKTSGFWQRWFQQWFQKWYQSWLKRRLPPHKNQTLSHRNIFILPTSSGIGFVFLCFLLWLLGTNYQNNLIIAIAFLLLSIMLVCILHTYANLSGLSITVSHTHGNHVGQNGHVQLFVSREHKRQHESLQLYFDKTLQSHCHLLDSHTAEVSINVPLTHRGWFSPPRLQVRSTFPLGLMVAWSSLDMDTAVLAYPEPIEGSATNNDASEHSDEQQDVATAHHGQEEFAGLRDYQAGDSIKHIAWRTLARGQNLATKLYDDCASQQRWLDWQNYAGLDREARLSRLCERALALSQNDTLFGLALPNQTIQPAKGEQHLTAVLKALALFEWQAEP